MLKVGVIGYGYWGPNVVRNFDSNCGSSVVAVCDTNQGALKRLSEHYAHIERTSDPEQVIRSIESDAIAIVTPVSSHFDLAKKALQNGKHVFVEKPLTETSEQSEELIELAEKRNLILMVDHTFLFTGAVQKIKELINQGTLGSLYYYDSMRVNLGLFQHDVNVIWDLAPHDLSILNFLIEEKAEAVVATGASHFNGLEDVAYITVFFPNNIIAHLNVNWLSPVKVRRTLIGGEKRMLLWDDLEADEKIKVYDKGVEMDENQSLYHLLVSYRSGDMWAPKISQSEALKTETDYFNQCIEKGENPHNDGRAGLDVVRLLEAANNSLRTRGKMVYL